MCNHFRQWILICIIECFNSIDKYNLSIFFAISVKDSANSPRVELDYKLALTLVLTHQVAIG